MHAKGAVVFIPSFGPAFPLVCFSHRHDSQAGCPHHPAEKFLFFWPGSDKGRHMSSGASVLTTLFVGDCREESVGSVERSVGNASALDHASSVLYNIPESTSSVASSASDAALSDVSRRHSRDGGRLSFDSITAAKGAPICLLMAVGACAPCSKAWGARSDTVLQADSGTVL